MAHNSRSRFDSNTSRVTNADNPYRGHSKRAPKYVDFIVYNDTNWGSKKGIDLDVFVQSSDKKLELSKLTMDVNLKISAVDGPALGGGAKAELAKTEGDVQSAYVKRGKSASFKVKSRYQTVTVKKHKGSEIFLSKRHDARYQHYRVLPKHIPDDASEENNLLVANRAPDDGKRVKKNSLTSSEKNSLTTSTSGRKKEEQRKSNRVSLTTSGQEKEQQKKEQRKSRRISTSGQEKEQQKTEQRKSRRISTSGQEKEQQKKEQRKSRRISTSGQKGTSKE